MSIQVDREKALEAAMTQIERQFGKGSIMKLGSQAVLDVPVIPTGSLALDKKTRNDFAILNFAFINHFHCIIKSYETFYVR